MAKIAITIIATIIIGITTLATLPPIPNTITHTTTTTATTITAIIQVGVEPNKESVISVIVLEDKSDEVDVLLDASAKLDVFPTISVIAALDNPFSIKVCANKEDVLY